MSPEISLCSVGDARQLAEVACDAFVVSPISTVTYKGVSRDQRIEKGTKNFTSLLEQENDESKREIKFLKAVDPETKEIMALAIWTRWSKGYNREDDWQTIPPGDAFPGNRDLARDFAVKTDDLRTARPDRMKPHWLLSLLCTSPNHERKGAASALVKWAFPRADTDGYSCWVDASDVGLKMYERCGFVDVGGISIDLTQYEGGQDAGTQTWKVMVREPLEQSPN